MNQLYQYKIKVSKNNKFYTENKTKQKPSHSKFKQSPIKNSPPTLGRWFHVNRVCSFTLTLVGRARLSCNFPGFRVSLKPTCLTGVPSGCHNAPILAQVGCGLWSVWATWTGTWRHKSILRKKGFSIKSFRVDPQSGSQEWHALSPQIKFFYHIWADAQGSSLQRPRML